MFYVTHCFQNSQLQHSTIKLYLCGIRFHFICKTGVNPLVTHDESMLPRVFLLLQAIKKTQIPTNRIRLPITHDILVKLCSAVDATVYTPFVKQMLRTAFIVAFYAFLRCGEFTVLSAFDPYSNLCMGDISFSGQCYVCVHLKSSKTDPGRRGVSILLFANNLDVCPYRALSGYLATRLAQGALASDPLFVVDDGSALTRYVFITALKHTLTLANFSPEAYSGHSFRSGAATSAGAANVQDHLIKTLGRWTSDSYVRYIKTPIDCLQRAQLAMSARRDTCI